MQRLRTRLRAGASTFPSATFALNFLTGGLDPAVTFTRSTTATFTGSNGLIQTAAINAPRFDYDPVTLAAKGLLIEEQRTNIALYSEQFDNAAWFKTNLTVVANTTAAPDGTSTADKLVATAVAGFHLPTIGTNVTSGVSYTLTFYVKAAEYSKVYISDGSSGGYSCAYDLAAGTAGTPGGVYTGKSASITNTGNGWYRCSLSFTATVTQASGPSVAGYPDTGATFNNFGVSYTGDGVSGVFAWGAQLEAGAFATSYIPTVASQVTRSADQASMTGTNFSSWYNQSEGTFVTSFDQNAVNSEVGYVGEVRTDNNNRIQLFANNGAGQVQLTVRNGGIVQADIAATGTITQGAVTNMAAAYKVNDFAVVRSGGTVETDLSGSVPTVTSFLIGFSQVASNLELNGHIRQIAYYNTRLPNATLQALTV